MATAKFIVLEGIDGAGTTSQTRRLADALTQGGIAVHTTREPSDGPVGRLLREMLLGKHAPVDNSTMALLFAADRADHVQREIDPALAAGKTVITDRYYHSSLAYQGEEQVRHWVLELNARARRPGLTVFLQVDAQEAQRRRTADNRQVELYDELEVQRRVAQNYLDVIALLSSREHVEIVDGNQTLDAVTHEIVRRAQQLWVS